MSILELDDAHTMNTKVSHGADVHAALYPFAALARDAIVAIYIRHAHSGRGAASWVLEEGLVDWYVVSTDPNILSKEYGRLWAAENEGEGPFHTAGVHALATVLGEFGGGAA